MQSNHNNSYPKKFNITITLTDYYLFRTSIYLATCYPSTIHNFTHFVRLNRLLVLQLRFSYIHICLFFTAMLHHSSVFISGSYRPCPFRVWDVSLPYWCLQISEKLKNAYLKIQNVRKHLFCIVMLILQLQINLYKVCDVIKHSNRHLYKKAWSKHCPDLALQIVFPCPWGETDDDNFWMIP